MKPNKIQSTIWLDFLNFIFIPFYIFTNILSLFKGLKIIDLIGLLVITIYDIITFYTVLKRRKMGYYLMYFFFLLSLVVMIYNLNSRYDLSYFITTGLGIVFWIVPNYIYLFKRRKVFYEHNLAHIKKCPGCNRIIPSHMKCCGKCDYKE